MTKDKDTLIDCRSKNCNLKYISISESYKTIRYGYAIQLITDADPKKLFYETISCSSCVSWLT